MVLRAGYSKKQPHCVLVLLSAPWLKVWSNHGSNHFSHIDDMSEATRALSSNRKKRGVVRASITKLRTRVGEVEAAASEEGAVDKLRRLANRLDTLFEEFKVHHFSVIDLLDEEDLVKEQELFDAQDEDVTQLSLRLEQLMSSGSGQSKMATKRLKQLEKGITSITDSVHTFPADGDVCLLQQLKEQLGEFKNQYSDIQRTLISTEVKDSSELGRLLSVLDKAIFDCSLRIRRLLHSRSSSSSSSSTSSSSTTDTVGVKLPKLEVPTFDGNILNWQAFWQQFDVVVHRRSDLANSEKLAYLCHALKSGSAKFVIDGLSKSGENYAEAITCLESRFDKPRQIHQAHVQKILEIPNLKHGHGKELRRLHDTALQHLRALKAMGKDPSGPFITAMLELKLDVDTMFEWQRHSQSSKEVPHYSKILDFINLRAQASEASNSTKKSSKSDSYSGKKNSKSITSFAASASADSPINDCVICKSERHSLYVCTRFRS